MRRMLPMFIQGLFKAYPGHLGLEKASMIDCLMFEWWRPSIMVRKLMLQISKMQKAGKIKGQLYFSKNVDCKFSIREIDEIVCNSLTIEITFKNIKASKT